jgi:hypothetical protein
VSTALVREVVDIDAPAERVWAYVVDWPRQSDWIPATRVWAVDEGAGVGARVEAWTSLGRVGFLDTMTITAWDPPHRCEVLHTGRVIRGEGGFVVAARGDDAARLEWWERLVLPAGPVGGLTWPLLRPVVGLGIRRALGTLKQGAEA